VTADAPSAHTTAANRPPSPRPAGDDARALVRQAVTRSVAQLLRHDPGARHGQPEDIHKFRVATRRLRSDLGTFRRILDRDWSQPLREELRWLGGEIGPVRDLDVLIDRLSAQLTARGDQGTPAAEAVLDHFRAARDVAHGHLQAVLLGIRYTTLLHRLAAAAEAPRFDPPTAADRPARDVAVEVVSKAWRRLRRGVADLPADPPDHELHEVRILAKRCRYAAEAVAPLVGDEATRFARAVEDVQTVLGDHQDTAVAEEALRRAADELVGGPVDVGPLVDALVADDRALRRRLRAEWPDVWAAATAPELRTWLDP
jgi:CHAD domain-containing protein